MGLDEESFTANRIIGHISKLDDLMQLALELDRRVDKARQLHQL